MSFKVIILLFFTALNFGFSAFVLLKNRKSIINLSCSMFFFFIALWSFGLAMFFFVYSESAGVLWAKFLYFMGSSISVGFFYFTLVFSSSRKLRKAMILPVSGLILLFILFFFTPHMIKGVAYSNNVKIFIYGKYHLLFDLHFICVFIAAYLRLFKVIKDSAGVKKEQARYMFIATSISVVFNSITNIIMPSWFHDFSGIWIGPCITLVMVILMTYTIIQHRLFDINIVIKRTIVYSSLIALITVIYILVIFIAERIFSHMIGYSSFIMTIIAATIIALVFIPLKNRIQYILDRTFFKGTLDSLAKQKELMQEELTRSERLKAVATLAAGMAHEIKNPLTAIKAFTEHLKERKDDPDFIAKFERIVGGEVDKINQLVRQLLDFSKPGLLNLKDVDLNSLLDEIITLLTSQVLRCKIIIVKSYSPDIGTIKADPNQLKQAFLNLMLNSIEAMPNGGGLSIVTAKDSARGIVEVSIQDTGIGILSKNLSNVFDPFYSTKESGTGLGLSITYDIIKKHNGTIKIESQPDKGTLVRVEIRG